MAVPPLFTADLDHVLAQTHEYWEEARDQSLFITGGTGFFGMWLLESFCHVNDALGLGMSATVLTRDPWAFARKAPHLSSRSDLRFIQGDVRSFEFPSGSFSYLIHAATAASAKLNEEAPHEMLNVIVDGTRHLLAFAEQCGVRKLLLTSSGAVYGKQPTEITHVTEDYRGAPDPLLPGSAYGEGKRVAEHLCAVHALNHSYEMKIARCFAFVGPHLPLNTHFAIGNFIRDALAGGPISVAGDGTPYRSYLYAADLSIWLWTILLRGSNISAYNVGSETDFPIGVVAQTVRDCATEPLPVQIAQAPAPVRPGSRYVPSTLKARTELGLRETVDLNEAIRRTLMWYQLT